ncbi:MAG: sulfatase [Polyangiales bacterium]
MVSTPPASAFDFRALEASDDEIPFAAAIVLADSDDPSFDERMQETVRSAAGSRRALEALEFVTWRRSGDPLPESAGTTQTNPDVLLISIDTLGADHLGCYGYDRDTSPNLDTLAARGVVFENALSTAPWTLPGHMSIFTSLYPSFHKLESRSRRLDPNVRTLTQSINELGYRTSAFVTHPFLAKHWGFGKGFDFFYRHREIVRAETQTSTVIDWLDWHLFHQRRGQEPEAFFVFVHYYDPHETYSPIVIFRHLKTTST